MKAVVYTKYGPPEVAKLKHVPDPILKKNEILVRVIMSTVNRTDSGFRSAEYFVSRFWSGLFRPKHQILGCEFTGIVEDIGTSVKHLKKGDKVVGFNDKSFGGHAELLTIDENAAVTTIPDNFSWETAAALTEGSHYALVNIRAAKIRKGQHVMVYGATGAIGSAAVQLLKHFGAVVTAVSNTENVVMVRSLGADTVIDYLKEDFTKTNQRFEFIFDAVGKSSYRACKPLLKEKGIYISTELGKNGVNILLALTTPLFGGKRLLFPIPSITKEDVNFLRNLAVSGEFKPVIDSTFSLEKIVEAYKYVESGQKVGNVLLKINM